MGAVLVFPSSLEASLEHLAAARRWGLRVVGASGVAADPYREQYDAWQSLPFISETAFLPALRDLITHHDVTMISTPHAPSYLHLSALLAQLPGVKLVGHSPYQEQMQRVKLAHERGKLAAARMQEFGADRSRSSEDFIAALLARTVPLYGESSLDKLTACCAAITQAPEGDVVEIGTFFGKSAYLLSQMARALGNRQVLAVDPWSLDQSVQLDSPLNIQNLSAVWDWGLVFQGFLLATQADCQGNLNYLRLPSARAWLHYSSGQPVSTPQFGTTQYSGKIALLHLDGNHDELAVREDWNLWRQALQPGSWVVFDDYQWSHGDGPRRVADNFKVTEAEKIARFFVAGGAAFFQLTGV